MEKTTQGNEKYGRAPFSWIHPGKLIFFHKYVFFFSVSVVLSGEALL